jgi:hypothetical protein
LTVVIENTHLVGQIDNKFKADIERDLAGGLREHFRAMLYNVYISPEAPRPEDDALLNILKTWSFTEDVKMSGGGEDQPLLSDSFKYELLPSSVTMKWSDNLTHKGFLANATVFKTKVILNPTTPAVPQAAGMDTVTYSADKAENVRVR